MFVAPSERSFQISGGVRPSVCLTAGCRYNNQDISLSVIAAVGGFKSKRAIVDELPQSPKTTEVYVRPIRTTEVYVRPIRTLVTSG